MFPIFEKYDVKNVLKLSKIINKETAIISVKATVQQLKKEDPEIRINMQKYSSLSGLSRSEQIRRVKDFVFKIRILEN